MTHPTLSPSSEALFIRLVQDAGNWSGEPMLGGNFDIDEAAKGNITDLKRKKLITTYTDRGDVFVQFTASARELANSLGLQDCYMGTK